MYSKAFLTTFFTLIATVAALPTENDVKKDSLSVGLSDSNLELLGCPSSNKIEWNGGGCEIDWAGNCFDRCTALGLTREGCCKGTINSSIESSGCIWGWNTCECVCMKG